MPDEPSNRKSEDGQRIGEPWVARSSWVSDGLGEGWIEVEPGIFRQKEPNDPAPATSPAEERPLEQTPRVARR
jgi:hypothetical protein